MIKELKTELEIRVVNAYLNKEISHYVKKVALIALDIAEQLESFPVGESIDTIYEVLIRSSSLPPEKNPFTNFTEKEIISMLNEIKIKTKKS